MSSPRKNAIDQLAAQVRAAQSAALSNPLHSASLEELRGLCATHKKGTNYSGWKNPYPKDNPKHMLLEYQYEVAHDKSRFMLMLQARQTGKDFSGEEIVAEDCMLRPGTDWMIAAPSERQALDSLSQCKLWAQAFDLTIADFQEHREGDSRTLLKSAECLFSNGARARAVPGKPDTVRGRSANVFLTEFDFFENPRATWAAILPSITNPLRGGEKRAILGSTPNGKGGAMYRLFHKADTEKMRWARHRVTIYHAFLAGLPVDIDALREAMDDPEMFAQEFELEWLDSSNVLLPYEVISTAETSEATEYCEHEFFLKSGNPVVCGIDFGRTNDPTVCWTLERVGDTWWTREVFVIRDTPTPDQEEMLRLRIQRAQLVCLDYTGPGIGLGDYLAKRFGEYDPASHLFGKLELCTFTPALKREMFPRLRQAFAAPVRVRIPISVEVREDLHQMRQIVANGQYSYSAPHTAEGHSDRCTALALAWRAASMTGAGSFFKPIPAQKAERHAQRTASRRRPLGTLP